MEWQVPLADLDYNEDEKRAVLEVLDRRWLTMGSETQEFENEFAQFCGARYAIAVSNATVALHLACIALGIGAGDEVIVPSLTFVATSNAVLYTGAQPRFADIQSLDELNISPESILAQISPQTRAIIVMHYGGYACQMEEILKIANQHKLAVIEDAAHAPGAKLGDRPLGTWGDVGCFSFFSNKNLSTGEGGMLVTDREDIAQRVRLLRSHGMTSFTWDRHKGHAYTYDVVDLGYNYRLDEIRSALGRVQLSKLEQNNRQRKFITERYWRELSGTDLGLPFYPLAGKTGYKPAYHIFPVILPERVDRKSFMDTLRVAGVQTSIHYPPIHKFSYYRNFHQEMTLPKTELAAAREVTLPLFPTMTEEQCSIVIHAVLEALAARKD